MKKTLIYIIGAGRSGTTLLDIILGNNDDAISLGEINRFFKRNGLPPQRDEQDDVFLFWEKIKSKIEENFSSLDYEALEKSFKKNEYHSGVFKSFLKKNDSEYKETLSAIYKVLTSTIQENIIIESSKYPIRALNISNYIKDESLEIKYIFIRKDPVKVVKSFAKKNIEQPAKSFIAANMYYLSVNILCFIAMYVLRKRGHKVYSLKYEDFQENPSETLNELSINLGTNFSYSIDTDSELKTGFLFDGNRIRLKETLFLETQKEKVIKDYKYYFIRVFNYLVYR